MGKRRASDEGSIFQRSDSRWVAVLNLGWRNGKRQRKYFYGETQAAAKDALNRAKKDLDDGFDFSQPNITVEQFLLQYLEAVAARKRPKTYSSYEGLVRVHLNPAFGRVRLDRLTEEHVEGFIREKLAAGLSPRTVRYCCVILRAALRRALTRRRVKRNVVANVELPPQESKEIEPFPPAEAQRFLMAIRGHRLECLFTAGLALGLREGEALALHWTDLDLDAATLQVRHTLQRLGRRHPSAGDKPKLVLMPPKTKRSRRTITLPDVVVRAFREHRDRQKADRVLAGDLWRQTGFVFTTTRGTPLDPRNVLREFHKVLRVAGIEPRPFHNLRHACATLLLLQNVHPRVVMQLLGHSSIRVTMDTYSHAIEVIQREASAKMDAILTPKAPDSAPVAVNLAVKTTTETVH